MERPFSWIYWTRGQDFICSSGEQHVTNGEGFMCVYAIDDMKSFEVIPQYIDFITRIKESPQVH